MDERVKNIFNNIPDRLSEEFFECLLDNKKLRIERIVSQGHTTPEGEWYDQLWDEWVILLEGEATLVFEPGELVRMKPGDFIHIAAHHRHRVEWTATDSNTVWLAVHFAPK